MWSLLEFMPSNLMIQVVDVGAALSEKPPYQSMMDAKRCRVVGFEPNPDACQHLNQTLGPPHRFFPYFVGDGQPATFYETNWAFTCSLFEPNKLLLDKFQQISDLIQLVAKHRVETVRLDDFDVIQGIDWIKIDIQGAELAVFQNATRILQHVSVIQTEVNFVEMYKGQPLFAELDIFLRSQGFILHRIHELASRTFKPLIVDNDVQSPGTQILWSDAIYVRDWMQLDRLQPNQLAAMATILHDAYHSFDLAHIALQALDQKLGLPTPVAPQYITRLIRDGVC